MNDSLPIREISRLTGVNTVTLRAWERRYGLLKPLRTHKGHRLYRREDVELVNTIRSWLARGLAISKVSELLESSHHETVIDAENIWQSYFQELLAIVSALNVTKLESFIGELFSIYPADIIADCLISPLLDHLNKKSFGDRVKQSVFTQRVCEFLHMLIQRHRNQAKGKCIAIIQLSTEINPLLNVMLHYGLTVNQYRCENVGLISPNEVVFLQENLSLDCIVIYNDSSLSLTEFQKLLMQIVQKITIPLVVAGKLNDALKLSDEYPAFPQHLLLAEGQGQKSIMEKLKEVFPAVDVKDDGIDTDMQEADRNAQA